MLDPALFGLARRHSWAAFGSEQVVRPGSGLTASGPGM
jgi:hypothetical protein